MNSQVDPKQLMQGIRSDLTKVEAAFQTIVEQNAKLVKQNTEIKELASKIEQDNQEKIGQQTKIQNLILKLKNQDKCKICEEMIEQILQILNLSEKMNEAQPPILEDIDQLSPIQHAGQSISPDTGGFNLSLLNFEEPDVNQFGLHNFFDPQNPESP